MDEFQEILDDFLVEAFEMIEQLDQDLVELENNPSDLELLNRIFRVAHTIKGSSSFLNFDILTKLTHHMEDVLNKARHGNLNITPAIMDVILVSIDKMKEILYFIRDNSNDKGNDIDYIVARLDAVSNGEDLKEEVNLEEENKEPEEEDYSHLSDEEIEAEIQRLLKEKEEEAKQKVANVSTKKESKKLKPVIKELKDDLGNKANDSSKHKVPATLEQTIRVDVKRLDHLMNLIGELVLGKNRLIKINDDVEEKYEGEEFLEELTQVVSMISLVTTDLQIAVMKTRMLPIGKVFNKFPRMIRDLSRDLNKKIDLKISGEDTELDKSIVEEIGDPLVHIIRNSCDHGIEAPEERVSKGKDELGTISLRAYNQGNHIVIEIIDDGKGLNADLLKDRCVEKNIISQKEADGMSDKDAFSLIFRPGFSTVSNVTNISGRGVGMDVVKTNIEKLNGIIDIDSELDRGTVMKLKIPLTLAIIQALLVGVQEEYYAIPLASVLETVRINKTDIYTVENKTVMNLRDEVLSIVYLGDLFGVENIFSTSDFTYVVVLMLAESKVGVIVDSLVGQEEIVIKSLGEYLKSIQGIAGATIRGDGRVTLIVDVGVLIEMSKNIKFTNTHVPSLPKVKEGYSALVVDDSDTSRNFVKKSLKSLNIDLVEAKDGVEALNILKTSKKLFDIVLIDIEMPKMDGYTLAKEIKKYNRFKNLPLVAVTSRTLKSDRIRGIEVGMIEYITKPYNSEYLLDIVKRVIDYKVKETV